MNEERELPASQKKRADVREKGQVVKSMDVTSTAMLAVGLFGLLALGSGLGMGMSKVMWMNFQALANPPSLANFSPSLYYLAVPTLWITLIGFLVLIAVLGVVVQLLQVGVHLSTEPLNFKMESLNPIDGFKRLFSLRRLVQTLFTLVKLVIIGFVVVSAFGELKESSVFQRPVTVVELSHFLIQVTWQIGWRVLLALALIALVDYLYQRWQFENDHKMSVQEMKDELRQTEGSPEVKSRQRALHRKKSIRRMLEDMSDATIVVTNPTHYAVALRYDRGKTPAPIVVAKGVRLIALRIRQRARELGVPIIENKPLARGLFKHGNLGKAIPMMYYQGVAMVLAQMLRQGFRTAPEPEIEEQTDE